MRGFTWVVALCVITIGAGETSAFDLGKIGHQGCDACDSPCCDCCDSGCDSGGCGICAMSDDWCSRFEKSKLGSLLRPSDHCFDDFISPMVNFVHFEDPRTLTEIRPVILHHNAPSSLGGGGLQLYAMEIRIALTERLSLIAPKDGFIVEKIKDGPLDTLLDDGWADVSAGLKYNFLRDVRTGTLASFGFTYEMPVGSRSALQRIGDGEFHLFGSAGQRLWCGNGHLMTAFGWRKPVDSSVQTESIHWSNHFDVRMTEQVYLVTEVTWQHWTDSADVGLPLGVGGQDLFNLPSTNVDGNDLVTQNVGVKFKPNRHVEAGFAYEFPLTEFKDVIDNRFQLDLILRY